MVIEKLTLKTARDRARLSQLEAANALGISADTLSNYERGKSFPDVLMLKKIEILYRVSYSQLIFLPKDYGLTVKEGGASDD